MRTEVPLKSSLGRHLVGFGVAAIWIALDQLTKSWAQSALASGPKFLFGHVGFELIYNSGIAFGIASGSSGLITLFGLAVSGVIAVSLIRTRHWGTTIGAALVLGGALGNVADRIFRANNGAVIDFLHSGIWPTFNLADFGVVVGLAIVVISSSRGEKSRTNPA